MESLLHTNSEAISSQSDNFSIGILMELLPSEWKLLLLIAEDLPKENIVDLMCVTSKSIETYITRIGGKLEISGKGKVARFARRNKDTLVEMHKRLYS